MIGGLDAMAIGVVTNPQFLLAAFCKEPVTIA